MNKITLLGRLTATPVLKKHEGKKDYVFFTVAVNKGSEALFFNCVAFDKTAQLICKYFKKGTPILVEGSVSIEKYEDKERVKVIVNEFSFIPKVKETPVQETPVAQ